MRRAMIIARSLLRSYRGQNSFLINNHQHDLLRTTMSSADKYATAGEDAKFEFRKLQPEDLKVASQEQLKEMIKIKKAERDALVREGWVRSMEARIVAKEIEKCAKGEGVNHYENCKFLRDLYLVKLDNMKKDGFRYIDV